MSVGSLSANWLSWSGGTRLLSLLKAVFSTFMGAAFGLKYGVGSSVSRNPAYRQCPVRAVAAICTLWLMIPSYTLTAMLYADLHNCSASSMVVMSCPSLGAILTSIFTPLPVLLTKAARVIGIIDATCFTHSSSAASVMLSTLRVIMPLKAFIILLPSLSIVISTDGRKLGRLCRWSYWAGHLSPCPMLFVV